MKGCLKYKKNILFEEEVFKFNFIIICTRIKITKTGDYTRLRSIQNYDHLSNLSLPFLGAIRKYLRAC